MDKDLAIKLLIFAAVLILIAVAGFQANKIEDLKYEQGEMAKDRQKLALDNDELRRRTRGQFKKKG